MKTKIALLLLIVTFASCWFHESEWFPIIKNYEVGWNDMVSNRCIAEKGTESHSEILINDYVSEVGNNQRYIIAKAHNNISDLNNPFYYIIDTEAKNTTKKVIGPLSKEKFKSELERLKITDVIFDKIFN
jgi:hypothetical protein